MTNARMKRLLYSVSWLVIGVLLGLIGGHFLSMPPTGLHEYIIVQQADARFEWVQIGGVCVFRCNENELPSGFLPCRGQSISQPQFSELLHSFNQSVQVSGSQELSALLPDMRGLVMAPIGDKNWLSPIGYPVLGFDPKIAQGQDARRVGKLIWAIKAF
jgi:hypothetical protein